MKKLAHRTKFESLKEMREFNIRKTNAALERTKATCEQK